MINRLIKVFNFEESERRNLVFSDSTKIRLDSVTSKFDHRILLKADQGGYYSTDSDIYFETGLITANALKSWLLFEPIYTENTLEPPSGTSVKFKVKTTIGNYFWDGLSWVVAGPSDWSTETEIRQNLSSFPMSTIGNKSIGFVVNLKTDNPKITPEIRCIKLLGLFDLEYYEDLIYDSLIRLLNTNFRTTSQVVFTTPSSISSINLDSVLENKGYNITGIRSVYNVTDDQLKLVNLFDSYVPGSSKQDGFTFEPGTVNFNSAVDINKIIEVTFEYVPEIIIKTNQDYFEVKTYPSLVFTQIADIFKRGFSVKDTNSMGKGFIRNKDTFYGVEQQSATQKTFKFTFSVFTNLQLDQIRMLKDIETFFTNNKLLTSWGTGNKYDIMLDDGINTVGNNAQNDNSDTNLATASFDILGVLFYDKPSIDVPLVLNWNNTVINRP